MVYGPKPSQHRFTPFGACSIVWEMFEVIQENHDILKWKNLWEPWVYELSSLYFKNCICRKQVDGLKHLHKNEVKKLESLLQERLVSTAAQDLRAIGPQFEAATPQSLALDESEKG